MIVKTNRSFAALNKTNCYILYFLQGYTPLGHVLVLLTFILSLVVIFGLMWYFVSIAVHGSAITAVRPLIATYFSAFLRLPSICCGSRWSGNSAEQKLGIVHDIYYSEK